MVKKISILPIGSGSSGNCSLLCVSEYKILVDAGLSTKRIRETLNRNNINLEDIDAVFITHTHSDHVGGLKVLVKHISAKVYATKTTLTHLKLDVNNSLKYKIRTEVLPGLFVTTHKTSHDCSGSACYIFECGNTKVSYVTDLGYVTNSIGKDMIGSDLVLIESNHDIERLKKGPYPYMLKERILSDNGHLSNLDCAYTINKLYEYGTRHFLLAHLSKENNLPELALNEVGKYELDADIRVLKDFSDEILKYELED